MTTSDILHQAKIKQTQGRQEILSAIVSLGRPVDVADILHKLKESQIDVDRATVFRTINLFIEHAILKRIEFAEGKFRYELASLPHHHHLVCTNCGKIDGIQGCSIPKTFEQHVSEKYAFIINSHSLEFFGLCKNCQKES